MDERVDEKTSCLLDNATLINACSLLTDPSTFDVHKLADLEAVCQAVLLNDRVVTLVGYSFRNGRNRFRAIYAKLIRSQVLKPKAIRGGQVEYDVGDPGDLNRVDAIARALDLDPVIANIEKVFAPRIPWRASTLTEPDDKNFWRSLTVGEGHLTSDSFPMYYFPKGERKIIPDGEINWGWEVNNNRETSWAATFVAQTFHYIAEAARLAVPYYCSDVRVPVVSGLSSAIKPRFFSVVHAALQHVERNVQEQVNEVLEFLGEESVHPVYLPGLAFALKRIRSRESFFEDLISLRADPELVEFRRWIENTRQAWLAQDIKAVRHSIAQLRQVGSVLSGLPSSDGDTAIAYIPKPDLAEFVPVQLGGSARSINHRSLVESLYDPTPTFLTSVGASLLDVDETRTAVERLIGRSLRGTDLHRMRSLSKARSSLYSPGKIAPNDAASVTFQTVEVTMGDRFENISQSTIINRSQMESSLNRMRADEAPAAAEALRQVASVVENSGNQLAVRRFDEFTEELARAEPRKGVLKALWEALVTTLPAIGQTAGLSDSVIGLFT